MRFSKIILIGSVLLIVTACGTQEKTPSNNNKTQVVSAPIKLRDKVKSKPELKQVTPALNLSIGSVLKENEKINDDLYVNNNAITEENSALFTTLNKKHIESNINLSAELLMDKNAGDDADFIKSVDGIQIDIQADFK